MIHSFMFLAPRVMSSLLKTSYLGWLGVVGPLSWLVGRGGSGRGILGLAVNWRLLTAR